MNSPLSTISSIIQVRTMKQVQGNQMWLECELNFKDLLFQNKFARRLMTLSVEPDIRLGFNTRSTVLDRKYRSLLLCIFFLIKLGFFIVNLTGGFLCWKASRLTVKRDSWGRVGKLENRTAFNQYLWFKREKHHHKTLFLPPTRL